MLSWFIRNQSEKAPFLINDKYQKDASVLEDWKGSIISTVNKMSGPKSCKIIWNSTIIVNEIKNQLKLFEFQLGVIFRLKMKKSKFSDYVDRPVFLSLKISNFRLVRLRRFVSFDDK